MSNRFKNKVEILSYLHENMSPNTLINNINLVMLSESQSMMDSLNLMLKHADLTTEQLSESMYTIESFIDKALTLDVHVQEEVQTSWIKLKDTVCNRIIEESSIDNICRREFIDNCMGPTINKCEGSKYGRIADLVCNNSQEIERFLRVIQKLEDENVMMSINTLEDLIVMLINHCSDSINDVELFTKVITSKVADTLACQEKDPCMQDLPYIKGLECLKDIFANKYNSVCDIEAKKVCESIFTAIEESVSKFKSPDTNIMPLIENFNPGTIHSLNGVTPMDGTYRKVDSILMNIASADSEEEITQELCELSRLFTLYETYGDELTDVTEASKVAKKIRSVARKSSKGVSKLDRAKRKGQEVKDATKKVTDPMADFINKTAKQAKEADSAERRRQILNRTVYQKIMRYIRRFIEVGGTGMVFGPTAAGIVLIGRMATDKYLDKKERAKMLRELETELKITREKIEDSKGDENKKAKYELMRLEDKLQQQIDKIRYNLKY